MSAEHDRQFFDTFLIVLGVLIGFSIFVYVVAQAIHARTQGSYQEENPMKAERIAERLAPVANVAIAGQPDSSAAPPEPEPQPVAATGAPQSGEAVYNSACMACHALAIAGSPKFGDPEVWAPRIARGIDVLYANAINGYQGEAGVMPAKGGRMDLSDAEVRAAVDYMVEAAQ